MKALDKYDTVRLLMTKGWQHKDVLKKEGEGLEAYAKRVFAHQCGIAEEYLSNEDIAINWLNVSEEIFEKREYREFMELVVRKRYTPIRAIITILQNRVVTDLELDESDIYKSEKTK